MGKQQNMKSQLKWVAIIAGLLIAIEIINLLSNRSLNGFSIYPRQFTTLPYIFTAPFLHGSISHFLSNLFTVCIFAFLLLQFGQRRFLFVSFGIVSITGLLVWCFGRSAYHLGASGVVYGYFGYLVLAGLLSRRLLLIAMSIFIGFMYGGIIWGVLPIMPGVSWESHLFGFLAGLGLALGYKNKPI